MIKKTRLFKFAAALGLLSALLVVPAQGWAQAISAGASAAAAANGAPIGQQFVISGDPEQEVYPSVAYNSQRQEYLVVWSPECLNVIYRQWRRISGLRDGFEFTLAFNISAKQARNGFLRVSSQ